MNKKETYCEEDVWEDGLESYLEEFEDSQIDILFTHDIVKSVPRLAGYKHRFFYNSFLKAYELAIVADWGRVLLLFDDLETVKKAANEVGDCKVLSDKEWLIEETKRQGVPILHGNKGFFKLRGGLMKFYGENVE